MNRGYGILFNRKSGKVVKVIEGSCALLKLFAMQGNVSATRDYLVLDHTGVCQGYFEGKKNDMPTICKDMVGMTYEKFGVDMSELEHLFV